ncbi:hypothetical protein BWQ96_06224 [Gracilariopsis chorda]|uniref:Uncharacterized protein n=1 Tax=Gracilariopsis chorda TaxID=448386 RepID=A0A2V3IPH7_9FLOR|nr:hypothetical protein BWQ96_06224 [Gracilariopsis chorda]|eukprot:PXF43991.1 hypothetical protein BWQ96_06224 [Gracilariopsis chorda]
MEDTSSSSTSMRTSRGTTGTAKVYKFSMATPQPFLALLEAEPIRIFLRAYDAYCRELKSRAAQLVQEASMSLEPIRPVGLVYCLDAKQLESAMDLGMIDHCMDVKDLSDNKLRAFLNNEAVESATVVTESDLSAMVLKHVRMDMSVKSATDRMKLLFIE